MRVEVLGTVRVHTPEGEVDLPSGKESALLAALALRAGRVVRVDTLLSALWGDRPPATARRTLQSHVSRLRRRLGSTTVESAPSGFLLALDPADTDVGALERLVAEGSAAARRRDVQAAREHFGRAERLWRGEPLTDWADGLDRQAQVDRLREMVLSARVGRLRADLDLGAPAASVDELRRLVADDPLREPVVALLMLALYRSGAQLDALRAYRTLQERLASSWGVEPCPDLQRLQWQILRQDPQLDVQPPLPPLVVPAPLTSFVGRDGQADKVAAALAADRLVTLHGPAGVGKSRLAQQVACGVRDRFPDGVWWVDLTVVDDEGGVPARVAQTLGVSTTPGAAVAEALVAFLEHRHLLLVLDNCEHVAHALGEAMLPVLQAAPGVRVLATSRVFLGLPGEARWDVPPLGVPNERDDEESIATCDAVVLFQRCRGHRVGDSSADSLAEVGRLCRRLDGLPLAIELAAAHTQQMAIREILDQLGREQLEARSPSGTRHASLARAIDWSYAELGSVSQRLFDRLSVFPGDFDAAAVEAIADGLPGAGRDGARTALATLVDACLVEATPLDEGTRYRLLFVMREFAGARLAERGEADSARRAFADHYRRLAVRAGPKLLGQTSGQWLRRLKQEWVNLQAALTWSMDNDGPARTLEFVRTMGEVVWVVSPDLAADVQALHCVLRRAEAAGCLSTGWGWQALVSAFYMAGDVALALEANDRAERHFLESGDSAGLACVYWHGGAAQLLAVGDLAAAERLLERGRLVARQAGVSKPEAFCLAHLVQLHCFRGTGAAEAQGALQAAEHLADPDDIQLQAHLRLDSALLRFAVGDMDACMSAADTCMEYSRQTQIATYEQAGHLVKGWAMLTTGHPDALTNALRAARIAADVGLRMQLGMALQQLARLADSTDDPARAAQLWGAGLARAPLWPVCQDMLVPRQAQQSLADRFDAEMAYGAQMDADQALALAIGG